MVTYINSPHFWTASYATELRIYAVDFLNMFHSIAITVRFNQSTYSVNENEGPAQPTLILSNSSSTDFTLQVTITDGSATGEY